ncbi:hypothetical protein CDL15_Pgr019450 [Punica granatum]|uniref:Uncharacterized protein n=1 Tax=Punica granatum TaxID=22663 RepID=A0A218W561_PUNGR|nr:hypothetical protein CDL15_Pgr019450 [Punica granatum]
MIGGGTAEVRAGTDAETRTGTDVEIGGGTSIGGSNIVAEAGGAGKLLTGWAAGTFTIVGADVSPLSGIKVGSAHGLGSTAGPYPGGGVKLEEARFGPLSRAMSSAILVAMVAVS